MDARRVYSSLPKLALILWLSSGVVSVGGEVVQNDDGSGVISFKPPTLNDEEQLSIHMPDNLKCDGCRAIAYRMTEAFKKAHKKLPKSIKSLPESDIIDVVDSLCNDKNVMNEYGLKVVKGVHMLSGPGLASNDIPGVMQGGGQWPNRLKEMCFKYIGELEDEDLYAEYRKDNLENYLCRGEKLFGFCKDSIKKQKKDEL